MSIRAMVLWLALGGVGCRTMPTTPMPVEQSRTYKAATCIDPEAHVLSITINAPTSDLRYRSPQSLVWGLVPPALGQYADAQFKKNCDRTIGVHLVGHATVELKSIDSKTGELKYLLTGVRDKDRGGIVDQLSKDKIGFAVMWTGAPGKLQLPEEVARDLNEPAEIGTRTARLRIIISEAAAQRMFEYFDEFNKRGIANNFSLAEYPLDGVGCGCTSFAASFLDVAGLLSEEYQSAWQRELLVPCRLVGGVETGQKVPVRRALFGPVAFRWAKPCEPHRLVRYYDTQLIYDWVHARACGGDCVTQAIGKELAVPVYTVDLRDKPVKSGAMFR